MTLTDDDDTWLRTVLSSQVPGKTTRRLQKNEELFAKGDPVTEIFLIRKGQLRVNATGPDGSVAVHEFAGPNSWLALRALDDGGVPVHVHTAVAIETSEVVAFALPLFSQMRIDYPCLNRLLVNAMAHHATYLSSVVEGHLFHTAEWRLARALLEMFPADENVTKLTVEMSMAKMAELIGCSHMTAKRFVEASEKVGRIVRRSRTRNDRTLYLYRGPLREYLLSDEGSDRDDEINIKAKTKTG